MSCPSRSDSPDIELYSLRVTDDPVGRPNEYNVLYANLEALRIRNSYRNLPLTQTFLLYYTSIMKLSLVLDSALLGLLALRVNSFSVLWRPSVPNYAHPLCVRATSPVFGQPSPRCSFNYRYMCSDCRSFFVVLPYRDP